MKASKDIIVHKIGAFYIIGESIKIDIFENNAKNKAFKSLLEKTIEIKSNLVSESNNIEEVSKNLDEKRKLVERFESLTGIVWRL